MPLRNTFFKKWGDLLLLSALLGAIACWTFATYNFHFQGAEDAAMLLRYADNLADGYGIVFNPGDEKVDGATDFLFMVMVSSFHRIGVSLETSVRVLGLSAHFLTLILVFLLLIRVVRAPRWMAMLSTVVLAFSPGPAYVELLFGTPVFAFMALLAFGFALRLSLDGISRENARGFAIASLLMGLVRPEGVIFAGLMLIMVIGLRGWRECRKGIWPYVLFFIVPGSVYFIWHWIYFGYPLPNPFYLKGGGTLHWDSLKSSFAAAWILLKPLLPILALGFIPFLGTKRTLFWLLPPVGFLASWILLSNEMNALFRFQYAAIPVLLVVWPMVLIEVTARIPIFQHWKETKRIPTSIAVLAIMAIVIFYQARLPYRFPDPQPDGRYDLAKELAVYEKFGYKMVITEAGNLPLYSRWKSLDAWGLNSKKVVHEGGVNEKMLAEWNPEIIMIHDSRTSLTGNQSRIPKWSDMCDVLFDYARKHNYYLAAIYSENANDGFWYYVRQDFPHSEEIITRIRFRHHYYSCVTGNVIYNMLLHPPLIKDY